MSKFCPAYKILRPLEGNYSNQSTDLGKETYGGISRKYWPDSEIWELVDKEKPLKWNQKLKDQTSEGLLETFYFKNFWEDIPLFKIKDQKVSTYIFCQRVNMGKTIIRLVQEIGGLKRDGILGSKTLSYINEDKDILSKLADRNISYYRNIVKNRPSQKSNLSGWLVRINRIRKNITNE